MFDAAPAARAIARYCYLDSNTILSARGGAQSFSHYASAEHQRRAFARERAIYEAATGVFVFSDFVRDSLIADFGISPTRVHTVYAGINLRVPSSTRDRERDLTILFVGRDFDRKGGPLLLRAFARVRARLPDARLIIAGCNPGVSGAGIETVGFVDKRTSAGEAQLADLYGRAAVFTMPSHFEPFGIPYAEAMHFGVPCVAVNHCAMPEIVTHGVTGLLVPPDDETALAQALVAVLQDPLRSRAMGEAARAKAQRLFDWGAVAQKMHAVAERDREAGSWRAAI